MKWPRSPKKARQSFHPHVGRRASLVPDRAAVTAAFVVTQVADDTVVIVAAFGFDIAGHRRHPPTFASPDLPTSGVRVVGTKRLDFEAAELNICHVEVGVLAFAGFTESHCDSLLGVTALECIEALQFLLQRIRNVDVDRPTVTTMGHMVRGKTQSHHLLNSRVK